MNIDENLIIGPEAEISLALFKITENRKQIVLVVDDDLKLLGTVTDGDIRRGILRGVRIDEPVARIMNDTPIVSTHNEDRDVLIHRMKTKKIRQCPVLDHLNRVYHIVFLDELLEGQLSDNWAVIMAGGQGMRLRPLTKDTPKPMLKVGDKPILENIVGNLKMFGIHKLFIALNFKADLIEQHFGDGSHYGMDIQYLREEKKLGTAGALSLLKERPKQPIVVMNSDLITEINFKHLIDFHEENEESSATMCIREYEIEVPYGVVETEECYLTSLKEKPVHRVFINAGIYVLDPDVLDYIPKDTYTDMTEIFSKLFNDRKRATVYPISEYWVDIGTIADLKRANSHHRSNRSKIK
ncbi:nucleotidyltransferase family protein [Thermodesulfobacteriota bacterium]